MYNSSTGPSGASGGGNWNTWNMSQNSAGTGASSLWFFGGFFGENFMIL